MTHLNYKIMSNIFHQKTIQEKAVHAYLVDTYGKDFFSLEDLLRMEIGEDGTVYLGISQIKTGIEL